jgi:WD40 repeat protein
MVEPQSDYHLISSNAQPMMASPVPEPLKAIKSISDLESLDLKSTFKSPKQELEDIFNYLYLFKPFSITTPFQGTCFQFTKDSSRVFFGSREGKIGVARLDTKQMIAEIELGAEQIWWIALANNDSVIYSGGASGVIKKFLVNDSKQLSEFRGHTREVNVILISNDEKYMYSAGDDGKIIQWDLINGENEFKILIEKPIHKFLGMDISEDNKFLAAVIANNVLVYDLEKYEMIEEINEILMDYLWSVNISPDNQFINVGSNSGVLIIIKFGTWEILKKIRIHENTIRSLKSSKDSAFIATASYDKNIKIFDIRGNNFGLELTGHTEWIKSLEILDDNRTIVSMSDDKTIRSWTIPRFDFYKMFELPYSVDFFSEMVQCSSNQDILIIFTKTSIFNIELPTLKYTNLQNDSMQRYIFAYNKIDDIIIFIFESYINLQKDTEAMENTIFDYKGSSLELVRKSKARFHGVGSIKFSHDYKMLVVGEHHRITLLNYPDYTVIHSFLSHKGVVMLISITYDKKYMYSADHEGQMKSYNLSLLSELKTLNQQDDPKVTQILECPNNEFFITFDSSENIHLWSTSKELKLWSKNIPGVKQKKFDNYSGSLFLMFDFKLVSLNIPSMESEFELTSETPMTGFSFSPDNSKISILTEDEVTVYQNPHNCSQISAFGDVKKIFDFYQYIGSLMSSKQHPYDSQFNSWILEPFHINMLHIYTYLGHEEYMQQAINDNISFIVSRSGYSPLDICLELNYVEGIDMLYKKLKKSSLENPFFLTLIEKSISRICSDRSERNTKILNLSFPESIDKSLHKFSHAAGSLPIIERTDLIFTDENHFTELIPFSVEGQPVVFNQTYFRVCLVPGAVKSIQLTEAILETENDRIFSTKFVEILLNEKWRQVRKVLWAQALVYFVYLFSLSYFSVMADFIFLIIAFGVNIILLLYELRQLAAGWSYFKDVWNYLDLITTVMMALMFVLCYLGKESDSLTSVVLIFSWARGISYFRIIKQTRYYINLLRNVMVDILPFLSIVLYSTLAFAMIFQTLDSKNPGFSSSFSMTWEMNIGGFNTEGFNGLTYFYFFLHSVLNPILMLNLLISIMSFSFEQVNSNVEVADAKELASMILEGENVFFWNRDRQDMSFLHVCQAVEREQSPDDINFMIKVMKKRISMITVNQDNVLKEVLDMKNAIGSIESTQETISKDIKSLLAVLAPNNEDD